MFTYTLQKISSKTPEFIEIWSEKKKKKNIFCSFSQHQNKESEASNSYTAICRQDENNEGVFFTSLVKIVRHIKDRQNITKDPKVYRTDMCIWDQGVV